MAQTTVRISADTADLFAQVSEVALLLELLPEPLRKIFARLFDDLLSQKLLKVENVPAVAAGDLRFRVSIAWLDEFRALALRALDFVDKPPGVMAANAIRDPLGALMRNGSAPEDLSP